VRGYSNTIREGNSLWLTSIEFKYPIIKEWNIRLDLPLIPKSLLTYRVALYVQTFADAGATKYRDDPLRIQDFNFGYGFGLTYLVLPYNIARTEIAFNDRGQIQFIASLGTSF
jgi:hypothetical protein